jgi:aspartate/methionine/tyrosine aminotransferase
MIMVKIAQRVKNIEYAIRDIYAAALEVQKTRKVHWLNIGDPGLFQDSFSTPKYICEALAKATMDGQNMYADSLGVYELRQVISESEKKKNHIDLHPNDILITQGVSEGIFFVNSALIEPGDEMLLPGPGYPTYNGYVKFFGGVDVEYKLDEEKGWIPDLADLEKKITPKTQGLLIGSPNNPTGGMISEQSMKDLINLAGQHNLVLLSDEIYDRIVFDDQKCTCPAALSKDVPIIGMNGFSKAHMSTGWRLGYLYFYDPLNKIQEIKKGIEKLARMRLCANTPAQYAAIESYKFPREHTERMVDNLQRRRNYCHKRMQKFSEMSAVLPKGTFYMFPKLHLDSRWKDDKEFVMDLLKETGVCFVYGSGFGNYGKNHFRMTFLPSNHELEEVFDKVEAYLNRKK